MTERYGLDDLTAPGFNAAHNAALLTSLERAQQARIAELEARLAEMERLYDRAAADLIEALDVASAYRATASTLHQEIERRNGVERRSGFTDFDALFTRRQGKSSTEAPGRKLGERRKSWPR
jgi:hypothetical protein